jgi:hypothetical protein
MILLGKMILRLIGLIHVLGVRILRKFEKALLEIWMVWS